MREAIALLIDFALTKVVLMNINLSCVVSVGLAARIKIFFFIAPFIYKILMKLAL